MRTKNNKSAVERDSVVVSILPAGDLKARVRNHSRTRQETGEEVGMETRL